MIDGMKVINLDSHLAGDLDNWGQTIDPQYREFLPRRQPSKDNERRRTLVGNRILVGAELGRQKAEKLERDQPGHRDRDDSGGVARRRLQPAAPACSWATAW
jgi:hypothetical protein